MVFAVEEINRNKSLLPGVTLGYRILDSCDSVQTSLRALLSLLSHSKPCMKEAHAHRRGFGEGLDYSKGGRLTREKKADHLYRKANSSEGMLNSKRKSNSVPSCCADSSIPAIIGLASSSPTRAGAHVLAPFSIPLVS